MKRLFSIKNSKTGKLFASEEGIAGALFYDNKKEAKNFRDVLNKFEDKPVYVVTKGPEHRNYNNV